MTNNTELDLFTPIIPEDKQHHNFKLTLAGSEDVKKTISSWTSGFIDRDNKIIKEFQRTYNSSFWEFYVYSCLKELNFDIDFSHERPDFIVSKDGTDLILEASTTNNPAGAKPEHDRDLPRKVTPENYYQIIHLATLRLYNTIYSKHKKYVDEYADLAHAKGKPYIICVAPFEQPFFFAQSDTAIRRVLYKYSTPIYNKDENSGEVRVIGKDYVDTVTNQNGAELELGFFTNDSMKEVSAVIFSNTATMTKVKALQSGKHPNTMFQAVRYQKNEWDTPYLIFERGEKYKESILDGLHIFLNPFAENKFNPELFFSNDIALHYYDDETEESLEIVEDGFLISHGCITAKGSVKAIGCSKKVSDQEYKDYSFNWEDGTLYKTNATVGLGINNYIAHYRGWTVVVFQDKVDQDWFAYAKNKIVFTIQEFINTKDPYKMLQPRSIEFSQSREQAYIEIKKTVDENQNKKRTSKKQKLTRKQKNKKERQRRKKTRRKK